MTSSVAHSMVRKTEPLDIGDSKITTLL